MPKTTVVF
jgi:phage-related protein